ncbi:MAG: type 2 isopentenyl-diphosphate Delta-isomerase [Bdellovibrionales bacterium]|nr:type 2 isopentenyl-diphosphate Delta-isomerase [Bdellovibrionales bacterium]
MIEPVNQFEGRKRDHIALALKEENEALGRAGFDTLDLLHEALPDINFSEINIECSILEMAQPAPFLISSMTAGHTDSTKINSRLAVASSEKGWLMGVGSQRRELFDATARQEWLNVRKSAPKVKLLGNLGLSQVIQTSTDKIKELADSIEAVAMIIHLNPLQECLQTEGTPQFAGGLKRISELVRDLQIPVVIKETGCGFSESTLNRLKETGVAAVDVSGFGGTHWGRIEGQRSLSASMHSLAAAAFSDWGVTTVQSLLNAQNVNPNFEVWASGGVRSGVDAAKAIALGANCVGFAKPLLQAALDGEGALVDKMSAFEYELKVSLFCTGCKNLSELKNKKVWAWRQKTTT